MNFRIRARPGFVHAELQGRETATEMREFLVAVHAACREHACSKVLLDIRRSRVIFKAEDYGLSGYVNDIVTPACQIALVADNRELHAAHEYIEIVARQQKMNVRSFRDQSTAVLWLQSIVTVDADDASTASLKR
jgi:hypothetical protein